MPLALPISARTSAIYNLINYSTTKIQCQPHFIIFSKDFLKSFPFSVKIRFFWKKALSNGEKRLTLPEIIAILKKTDPKKELAMDATVLLKPLSSLEKCFPDDKIEAHPSKERYVMLKNERLALQIGIQCHHEAPPHRPPMARVRVRGALKKFITLRTVESVASTYPVSAKSQDPDYLRRAPGLYPDAIRSFSYPNQEIPLAEGLLQSIWINVDLRGEIEAGEYETEIALIDQNQACIAKTTFFVRVLGAELPKQSLIHTEWFYTDCIAEANREKPFSERHWKHVEDYLRVAAQSGINAILTPVFTPELDTEIGKYRLTTQLVSITVVAKKQYVFDFSLLERWIDLCLELGIEYFEIPHFFTQWGAKAAPKFVARMGEGGPIKRIFGWDTDALGEEYECFLSQFIPALLEVLKQKGVDKSCIFHVSDEPSLDHLDHYKKCRELISRYLGDSALIIDALSNIDFYNSGALSTPVPHIAHIKPFLERDIDDLWAYYCGYTDGITGRLLAHPLYRTRILGVQLWKHRIKGFLHWGYNFYHTRRSHSVLDPYADSHGTFFAPSGDAFLVYPNVSGGADESLRLNALREAMDDIRLLELAESHLGRTRVEEIIKEISGKEELTFFDYPHSASFLLELHDTLALAVEHALR